MIEADGHAVTKSDELNGTVRAAAAGSDLKLKIKRGSSTHDITVTLATPTARSKQPEAKRVAPTNVERYG